MLVVRNILVALVASSAMAVVLARTGSAVATSSTSSTSLIYQISNMPAGSSLDVVYTGGVTSISSGFAQSRHGGFRTVAFQSNYAVSVDAAASGGALYGNVSERLGVSGPVITGNADVPAGATVKLQNPDTDQTIDLPSGPFTIDATLTSFEELSTSEESIRCHGTTASCKAIVAIGGEAHERRVTVDTLQAEPAGTHLVLTFAGLARG